MRTGSAQTTAGRPARAVVLGALATLLAATSAGLAVRDAPAQSLQEKMEATQAGIDKAKDKEGVLTTEISHYSDRIDTLAGQVAELRNREAVVQEQLDQKQAELEAQQERLEQLRARLQLSISALSDRLVAIYKSGEPDVISVILSADGFDDLLARTEYLQSIENRDSEIVNHVRDLRNQTQQTVAAVKAARNAIAAKRQELEQTRTTLEARTAELDAARDQQAATLSKVREHREKLEGDLTEISEQIAQQLQNTSSPLPAQPIRGGSGGMIWPVAGSVVSGFGMRWGRMHEGIDIASPGGTPIRAAKSGRIVLAAATGGYGNYTCIDHGGSLSTCYAHQSRFAMTGGSVSQGTVIGYVGCTGSCTGDHLHFEVRINGSATDPLAYL
jgi:murein DD-endopeptidase MepM/ murein hydrolase activator NlpD